MATFPEKHQEKIDDVRLAQVWPFPFGVFFLIEDPIVVLAVLDLRADPETRQRILESRRRE